MSDTVQHTAAAIAAKVKSLVSPPSTYLQLRQVMKDPMSSIRDLARVVSTDPSLTARLLRVANSAFFCGGRGVDTVDRAVMVLGTQQVHDIVLATSVMSQFSRIPVRLVDMNGFWRTSLFAAVASRVLADRCSIFDSERVFVAGLLAQIGQLVLYLSVPDTMRQLLQVLQAEDRPVHVVERLLLGFDYAAVGGELLAGWNLPASLVDPIRYHTDPDVAGGHVLEASLVSIAVALAGDAARPDRVADLGRHLRPETLARAQLTAADLPPLLAEVAEMTGEAEIAYLAAA